MKKSQIIISIFFLMFLIVAIFTKGFGLIGSNPEGPTTSNIDSFVTIPISGITSNAKWYEYDSGGSRLRFFAARQAMGPSRQLLMLATSVITQKRATDRKAIIWFAITAVIAIQ